MATRNHGALAAERDAAGRPAALADGKIAHSAAITLGRPRDRDHPDLVALRIRLLTELGVATGDVD